jgi:predicted transcriptional regulator
VGIIEDKSRLQRAFESTAHWADRQLERAATAREREFLSTVRRYASQSLAKLSAARTTRDVKKLRARLEKLETAVILYVQRRLT